jgi:hypothetical protein
MDVPGGTMPRQLLVIALLSVSVTSACTRVGSAPASPPAPFEPGPEATTSDVLFSGTVTLGDQRLPVTLELRGGGDARRQATLRIPDLPVEASGEGVWSGDRIRLELRYGDGCPGTLAVDARVTEHGAEGTLEARDCTGTDAGRLLLVRQSTAARDRRARR